MKLQGPILVGAQTGQEVRASKRVFHCQLAFRLNDGGTRHFALRPAASRIKSFMS